MVHDRSFGSRLFNAVNITLMLLVIAATLFPFYHMAVVSISDGNAVLRGDVSIWPVGLSTEAYNLVFENRTVGIALRNSLWYTTIGTIINLFMTALCAFPLSRPRFSGRTFFTWMVTLTMFFSGGLIPLYLLILALGMRDNTLALVLPPAINVWYMFILRTNFQQVPEELYEAAIIDGANDLQALFRIYLPLAKPVLATLLLFYAVAHWNEFFRALIFLDDRANYPIQLVMRSIVIQGNMQANELNPSAELAVTERGLKYATILVSTLPILVVYPFVQRYFVKGVMIGAIKG
jgi:putative aldouronate transport system permease protein